MTDFLTTDAQVDLPALVHGRGCACTLHARRRLGGALFGSGLLAATPAWAQEAPDPECKRSTFTQLSSAASVEQAAGQQYQQMLQQANQQRALVAADHPQVKRLRYIADRIIPFANTCNGSAKQWRWEVNLIDAKDVNAFCMPGGKIAFYAGILQTLKLDDDEVAMIMGHEVAHALLEHARERMGKTALTRGGIEIVSALLGLGDLGRAAMGVGGQLATLTYSRSDETEADALGLVLAAKAGYRPEAGVTLWQKMMAANKGKQIALLSTHPTNDQRIRDIQGRLPRVTPLYARAAKPDKRFAAPTA